MRVCQPKVYGDIQSHHNMSSTLHILSAVKYQHYRDIARKEWKIDNVEIKIVMFGVKSIVAPFYESKSR